MSKVSSLLRSVFLTFVIIKPFSGQFGTEPFTKIFLNFNMLILLPTLNLRPSNICLVLHRQVSFWLFYDMYYCIYLLFHLICQYTDFLILKSCIYKFYSLNSNKSFSNHKFTFIMCWVNVYIIILQKWFYWPIVKFTAFIYLYYVWFANRFI